MLVAEFDRFRALTDITTSRSRVEVTHGLAARVALSRSFFASVSSSSPG